MINSKLTHFPSDIKCFERVVSMSGRIFEDANKTLFSSPFSIVPLISQVMGLTNPLLGTGNSPYSLVSLAFHLRQNKQLLSELFDIPIVEKRRIIDEIYEMIAPCLLKEEGEYLDLVSTTKYQQLFKESPKQHGVYCSTLEQKISLLSTFIDGFEYKGGDFGHVVHYGHPEDLIREFSFLEDFPDAAAQKWREGSYPVVNEMCIKGFPRTDLNTKQSLTGWIIFITNHTRELLIDGKLRKKKILQAAQLAQRLGAKLIGMGGLIASFSQGGHHLSGKLNNIGLTTGHAYTIGNIIETMQKSVELMHLDIRNITIAIVGAAGSIGSGCAKILAELSPKKIILVDLNTFDARNRLGRLRETINDITPPIEVIPSSRLEDIAVADVIICATSSPTSIIAREHIKRHAIVIDDAFPKNVSKTILHEREDIILLEGGMMQLPSTIDVYFSRNMPDLLDAPLTRLVSCKETYSCAAETLLLSLYDYNAVYGLGHADPILAKDIINKGKMVGCSSAPLQCFDEAVEAHRFQKRAMKTRTR